jgi:hypothetical protein
MPRRRRIPPELEGLARAQSEIVARSQLRALPLPVDRHQVRRRTRSELWSPLGGNVVALHTGTLTAEQRLWRAVLAQGEQLVALAGPTAAALHGLTGFESDTVHVLLPLGARVHRLDGVTVHVSRRFTRRDLHPVKRPPAVRLERSVIDAAAWSDNPRRACALVASAVQQRLSTADRLLTELGTTTRVRHRRLLGSVLVDIAGGAQALSELDLVRVCRRHGLPEPRLQVVRRDRHGRRRWLDAVFDLPRGRELVVDGKAVVRVAAVTLRLAEARVADQLGRLLRLSD